MKERENQPIDTTSKLFRAENNLNIHTVLRTNYGSETQKNFRDQPELVEEATALLMNEAMNMTTKNANAFRK